MPENFLKKLSNRIEVRFNKKKSQLRIIIKQLDKNIITTLNPEDGSPFESVLLKELIIRLQEFVIFHY